MSNTSEGVENGETKGGDNVAQKQVTPTRTSGGQFVVTGSREGSLNILVKKLSKCTGKVRKSDLMFLNPIKNDIEKVRDPDVSINEKHRILSKPQVGHGNFLC